MEQTFGAARLHSVQEPRSPDKALDCEGCAYVDQDISAGVEIILIEEVPGVIRCDASMQLPDDVLQEYQARKAKEKQEIN